MPRKGPSRGAVRTPALPTGRRSGAAPWGRGGRGGAPPPAARRPARPPALLPVIELVLGARQRVNHEMDGRHGASFSSSSRGRPPPARLPPPPNPFPSSKPTATAAAASRSPNERSKCAGAAAAAAASLPGVCPRRGGPAGRAGGRINTPPRSLSDRAQECEAGGRDPGRAAAAAATGSRTSGERGPTEEGRGTGCGLWGRCVVPAADGVRTREVGREMSPLGASLARRSRRRRHQHRRRHLHFCPSFSVSQAPLPSGGGGANGRRRRREETGGRGARPRGGGAPGNGRRGPADWAAQPRRCKARADWAVRLPSPAPPPGGVGSLPSECSGEHVFGTDEAEGRAGWGGESGREAKCVSPARWWWEGTGAPPVSRSDFSWGSPNYFADP